MDSPKLNEIQPLTKAENAGRWAAWLGVLWIITGAAAVFSAINGGNSVSLLSAVSGVCLLGAVIAIIAKETAADGRTDGKAALDIEKGQLEIEKLRLEVEKLRRELEPKDPPTP